VVMKLIQTHFLNARPIAVTGNSPQQKVPGTDFVDRGPTPTGSPTYPLDVLAAFSSDRKRFLLSVVNPSEDAHGFTPSIRAVKLREGGKLYQIAPGSVNSANEAGKEPEVNIVETALEAFPRTIDAPPVSISIYVFDVQPA
jgi:alpha-L-arabinofuranosidase